MSTDSRLGFVFKKAVPVLVALFQLAGCAAYGPKKDNEPPAAADPILVKNPFKKGTGPDAYVQAKRSYATASNTLQPMEKSIPADATVLMLRPTNPGEKAIFYRKNGTIKNPAKDCLNGKQCAKVSERLGVYERIEMEKLTAVEIKNAAPVPQQSMVTQELSKDPEDNVIVMFLRYRGRDAWEEGRDSTPSHLPTLGTLNDPSITWSSELLPYVAKKYTDAAYMILSGSGQFVMGVGTGFGNVLKGIAAIKESERRTQLPDLDFQYTSNSNANDNINKNTLTNKNKLQGGNTSSGATGGSIDDSANNQNEVQQKTNQENNQKNDQKNDQKTNQENYQKNDQKTNQENYQENYQKQQQDQGQKQGQGQKQEGDKNSGHGGCTHKDSRGNCQSDASDMLFQQQMLATLLFGGIFDGKHVFIESQQQAETSTTAAQVAARPANRGPVAYRAYPLPNKIPA